MINANLESLFQPFTLKSLTLKNRIVMAPMTRTFSPQGIPGDNVAAYYRRRAEAGRGFDSVRRDCHPAGRHRATIPAFRISTGDKSLAGWKHIIDEVHAGGGKMGPQNLACGIRAGSGTDWVPDAPIESPSGLLAPGAPRGVAMSEEDIADAIAAFARAAAMPSDWDSTSSRFMERTATSSISSSGQARICARTNMRDRPSRNALALPNTS